eukprot:635693-Pleurochrysis_carterae.AAC.1
MCLLSDSSELLFFLEPAKKRALLLAAFCTRVAFILLWRVLRGACGAAGPKNGVVTFVGVPEPTAHWKVGAVPAGQRPITLLTL